MRQAWALVTWSFIGVFGLTVMAAEKPSEQYSKAMKDIGAATQSLNKAMQAGDFDTLATTAGTVIDTFTVVDKYWNGKADDAVKLVQTAAKAAADLRVAAGLKSAEGVAYSFKELTDTCTQCHMAHREKLPDGSFQIK